MAGECHSSVLRWHTVFRDLRQRSRRRSYTPGGACPWLRHWIAADESTQLEKMVQHLCICQYSPYRATCQRTVGGFRTQHSSGSGNEERGFLGLQEFPGDRIENPANPRRVLQPL